jgi:FkbM family methyltransferase
MWYTARKLAWTPPRPIRGLWQRCLLASTGRLLRKEGVERLVCYDIGARWGIWRPFRKLPMPILKVGFEPDPAEAKRLAESGAFDRVAPVALSGKGGTRTLFVAREPACSSICGPDMDVIRQHSGSEIFTTVRQVPLETITLQQAIEKFDLPNPDFIKIDVEGAELEILTGAQDIIRDCSGILFESSLAPLYLNGSLFGDVATHLLRQGFSITSFDPIGSHGGTHMVIDASACRNPKIENRRQYLLKTAAFALLVENFEFALNCLRRVASKREILIG